jgi:hypothetical protein
MWLVGIVGLAGALVATVISFIPPKQISTGSPVIYVGILLVGSAVFAAIPFIVYAFHKPTWKAADSDFEPFEWQIKAREAGQTSGSSQPPHSATGTALPGAAGGA